MWSPGLGPCVFGSGSVVVLRGFARALLTVKLSPLRVSLVFEKYVFSLYDSPL